jgi:arginyl-tRNA synthetase
MIKFKTQLQKKIHERLKDKYPLALTDIEFLNPPQQKMGDWALSFPFQLAKKIKANPRQIAQEMMARLESLPGVEKMEIAGAGYINLFLDKKRFFRDQLRSLPSTELRPQEKKIVVEHTNINPNKAAHIGHLRNACLGDTLVRCLRYKGEIVEVQNYIDDTGVQVVDVVFGFMELEKKTLSDLEAIKNKFDYYCWNLYARTSSYLQAHPEAQARKADILKKIEHSQNPEIAMARHVSRRILRAHLATMKRIGVTYDVLPCESSILGMKFWERAFELLKEKKGIYSVTDGPNAKCWVMKLEDEADKEKIIVRSDGTVTYVGKDIAYQLWKFGLLEKDFYYEPFLEDGGHTIWMSTSVPNKNAQSFGGASKVYNVIDTRQSYLQKVVVQGLRALHFDGEAEKSIHFSYEMVALSPKSLKELGVKISDDDAGKQFLEVSGRKGLGVKADDLLDRLEEKALAEVEKRNPDLPAEQKRRTSAQIACGALRYFMLKYARNSLIIFDFDDALSFEGETGPYLQYTAVRLNSIFRKMEEREGKSAAAIEKFLAEADFPLEALAAQELADFWDVVLCAAKFEEEILHSIESLEFSHLAKFAFNLCQKLNGYYHKYQVLAEENVVLKNIRTATIFFGQKILSRALDLMGVPVPERM